MPIVAATNRDLERRIADGSSEDLFYRPTSCDPVAALRDRKEDIRAQRRVSPRRLAAAWAVRQPGFRVTRVNCSSIPLPGDVCELRDVLERARDSVRQQIYITTERLALEGTVPAPSPAVGTSTAKVQSTGSQPGPSAMQ